MPKLFGPPEPPPAKLPPPAPAPAPVARPPVAYKVIAWPPDPGPPPPTPTPLPGPVSEQRCQALRDQLHRLSQQLAALRKIKAPVTTDANGCVTV
jgi:hypothetical protein